MMCLPVYFYSWFYFEFIQFVLKVAADWCDISGKIKNCVMYCYNYWFIFRVENMVLRNITSDTNEAWEQTTQDDVPIVYNVFSLNCISTQNLNFY